MSERSNPYLIFIELKTRGKLGKIIPEDIWYLDQDGVLTEELKNLLTEPIICKYPGFKLEKK